MHQMHEELKPLRLTSRPQIQTEFKGKKVRAVRSGVYFRPLEEAFHEFLVNHLLWKFGKHWFDNEIKKGREDRHVVLQWRAELHEQVRSALKEKVDSKGPIAVVPTGNAQALLVLADDVYQVEHALRTPRRIMERLRDHTQFQGARYEILAASIFARCGFTIDFINDKTKKMPEFFATKERPAEKTAVEVKSRHRAGVLHHPARPNGRPKKIELRADVEHLVREALDQNPGGMPFIIFVDLNLPLTPGIPTREKPWFKDLEDIFDRLETGAGHGPEEVTGFVFTNFGWHYHRDRGLPGNEYVISPARNPRYPLSQATWEFLKRALDEYGFIPDEELHEKEVRARYPEFNSNE